MKRIIEIMLIGMLGSGMLWAQPAQNVENISNQVISGVGSVMGAIQQRHAANAAAMLLYGEEGREADGYVVARGTDGYYSVWSTTNEWWQIMEPSQVLEMLRDGEIIQALHAAPLWRYFAEIG